MDGGIPTMDRGGVPTLDGEGVPTLDGEGYLPWMVGGGTYLGWGIPTLDGGELPALDNHPPPPAAWKHLKIYCV